MKLRLNLGTEISLHIVDVLIIGLYIVILLALGFWVSFRRKHAEDLFLAGRKLTWPFIGLSIFGVNITPQLLLSSCSVSFKSGMVAANFDWLAWIFLVLLAMVFLPHYLSTKIFTMPEFMEKRFNKSCRIFLSWYVLLSILVIWLGGALYAGGILLSQISGWPLWIALIFLVVIAVSFTMAGGLEAVVIADSFQSTLIILASAILTFIGLYKIGGIAELLKATPSDYWQLFRPMSDKMYPWHAIILGYPVLGIWFWCTDQTIVQRMLGAKNIQQGQKAAVFTGFLKILAPFLFFMPGILCFVLFPQLKNPDQAYITMVGKLLPRGMIGLIIAVMIAALFSTINSALNSFSTVFTLDIYKNFFRPDANNKEVKLVGRLMTLMVGIIAYFTALGMATFGKDLFDLFVGILAFFAPPMSAVFLIGVIWKRTTGKAAFLTLVFGSIVSLTVGACQFCRWPTDVFWPHYMLLSFYLFSGIAIFLILVSLLTKNEPNEQEFFAVWNESTGVLNTRNIWRLWLVLAVIMSMLYLIFN
jgi:SSS family solute:Na+ symporter